MAVLFAVFLNEQMMKTKTEINKQKKTDISTSERQLSANGCQHPYACSIIFFGNRCLWIAVFVLVRPSQHKSGRWAKKNNNNKQANRTKPITTTTKRNTPRIGVPVGFFFFFFSFFKVFTECPFYAQRAHPTNKTTSVNTASFNSLKKKNNNSVLSAEKGSKH